MRNQNIWISWENHRRSRELAHVFNARIFIKDLRASRWMRYILLPWWTAYVLLCERPRAVFCQNPSIILAAQLCLLKPIFGYTLIVDRHSNFKLPTRTSRAIKWRLFHAIGDYTLRVADLTIVTNDFLSQLVISLGGRSVVLPDKLPTLPLAHAKPLPDDMSLVFICTFSWDEPVREVVQAALTLPQGYRVFITGRPKEAVLPAQMREAASERVTFTGFLPEADYQSLLASADILIVLTTNEHTLLCGAYEAVSLGKPLVLSGTAALRSYFRRGAVYCDPNAESIRAAIMQAAADHSHLVAEMERLKRELSSDWDVRFGTIRTEMEARTVADRK